MSTVSNDGVKQFETGAVRSKDVEATPFHLITPIGLRRLAEVYTNSTDWLETLDEEIPEALQINDTIDRIYSYLEGQRLSEGAEEDELAMAAALLCETFVGPNEDGADTTPDRTNPYRYDRIPLKALFSLATTYAEGRDKYGACNWEKGMHPDDMLNHVIVHLFKYLSGDRNEDHKGHALWGLLGAMHMEELHPELCGNLRSLGCFPPEPEVEATDETSEEKPNDWDLVFDKPPELLELRTALARAMVNKEEKEFANTIIKRNEASHGPNTLFGVPLVTSPILIHDDNPFIIFGPSQLIPESIWRKRPQLEEDESNTR